MNLAVADPMKPGGLNASARLWHEVMGIALRRRDWPVAQRAYHGVLVVDAPRERRLLRLPPLDPSLHLGGMFMRLA
jgi:hypothetical protein